MCVGLISWGQKILCLSLFRKQQIIFHFILIPQTSGTVHCNTFISLLYPAHSWRISLQYICRLSVCKHRLCFFVSDASAADFFNENSTDFIVHGLHFNKLCACTCFFIKKTSAFCCEKETI